MKELKRLKKYKQFTVKETALEKFLKYLSAFEMDKQSFEASLNSGVIDSAKLRKYAAEMEVAHAQEKSRFKQAGDDDRETNSEVTSQNLTQSFKNYLERPENILSPDRASVLIVYDKCNQIEQFQKEDIFKKEQVIDIRIKFYKELQQIFLQKLYIRDENAL